MDQAAGAVQGVPWGLGLPWLAMVCKGPASLGDGALTAGQAKGSSAREQQSQQVPESHSHNRNRAIVLRLHRGCHGALGRKERT